MIHGRVARRPLPPLRFIEFVGLSGSGKSTLAGHVLERLCAEGIGACARADRLADRAPFLPRQLSRSRVVAAGLLRRPGLFLRGARLVVRGGQETARDLAKVVWNLWTVIGLLLAHRRSRRGVMIVDQGLAQAVWSVRLTARDQTAARGWPDLLQAVGLDDVLLVVTEAPAEIARQRLQDRAVHDTRMKEAGRAGDEETWARAGTSMEQVVSTLRGLLPDDRVIAVRTDGSSRVEDLAARVAKAYMNMEASGPARQV